MARFVNATFTVGSTTSLPSYVPETGGGFTTLNGVAAQVDNATQAVQSASNALAQAICTATPPSANYRIGTTLSRTGTSGSSTPGILARVADPSNYLGLSVGDATGSVNLFRRVGGTSTTIDSWTLPDGFPANTPHAFELIVLDGNASVKVDGVVVIAPTPHTSGLTAAGNVGLQMWQTGRVDNLTADTIAQAVGTTPVPALRDVTGVSSATNTVRTWTHTVTGTGTQTVIVFFGGEGNGTTPPVFAATIDGTAMQFELNCVGSVSRVVGGSIFTAQVSGPGAHTIVITQSSGPTSGREIGFSATLQGGLQLRPEVKGTSNNGAVGTVTDAFNTLSPNCFAIDFMHADTGSAAFVPNTGQEWVFQNNPLMGTNASRLMVSTKMVAAQGATSMGWTLPGAGPRSSHSWLVFATEVPPTDTIAVADIAPYRVFQRIGGQATIALSGTYTGTAPSAVRASVVAFADGASVVALTPLGGLAVDTAANTWSGTIVVPQGGYYRLGEVRSVTAGGAQLATIAGVNRWAVGVLIAGYGSSTLEYMSSTTGTSVASPFAVTYRDPAYGEANPGWKAVTLGEGQITLLNGVIAATGVPAAFINCGVGGSALYTNSSGTWSDPTSFVRTCLNASIASVGGKFEFLVQMGLGGNDGGQQIGPSLTALRNLKSYILGVVGQPNLKLFITGIQYSSDTTNDVGGSNMREAQRQFGQDTDNAYVRGTVDLVPLAGDNIHLTGVSYNILVTQMVRAIGALVYGSGLAWRPPEFTSAAVVDGFTTDVTATIYSGTDLLPASGGTGFLVSGDGGTTKVAATSVRTGIATVRITTATSVGVTAGQRRIYYDYGGAPDVSAPLTDNSAAAVAFVSLLALPAADLGGVALAPAAARFGLAAEVPATSFVPPPTVNYTPAAAIFGLAADVPVTGFVPPATVVYSPAAARFALAAGAPLVGFVPPATVVYTAAGVAFVLAAAVPNIGFVPPPTVLYAPVAARFALGASVPLVGFTPPATVLYAAADATFAPYSGEPAIGFVPPPTVFYLPDPASFGLLADAPGVVTGVSRPPALRCVAVAAAPSSMATRFAGAADPGDVVDWGLDVAGLLDPVEKIALDWTIAFGTEAAPLGISLLRGNMFGPDLAIDGTTFVFWAMVDPAAQARPQFDGFGVEIAVTVDFATTHAPARRMERTALLTFRNL